jgi:hypothetical protein
MHPLPPLHRAWTRRRCPSQRSRGSQLRTTAVASSSPTAMASASSPCSICDGRRKRRAAPCEAVRCDSSDPRLGCYFERNSTCTATRNSDATRLHPSTVRRPRRPHPGAKHPIWRSIAPGQTLSRCSQSVGLLQSKVLLSNPLPRHHFIQGCVSSVECGRWPLRLRSNSATIACCRSTNRLPSATFLRADAGKTSFPRATHDLAHAS